MGLSLFTSSFEVISLWKVSFMARACRDGPFALIRSHGHTAAAFSTKRIRFFFFYLLSKPWIWMSTPPFLIWFFFSSLFGHQRFISACVFVHAFFTHRFFFSSFVCPLTGAYEWQQTVWFYSLQRLYFMALKAECLPKDVTFNFYTFECIFWMHIQFTEWTFKYITHSYTNKYIIPFFFSFFSLSTNL